MAKAGKKKSESRVRAEARVGEAVGSWHLDALLGLGGMAAVYAATKDDGSRAAMKMLRSAARETPGAR